MTSMRGERGAQRAQSLLRDVEFLGSEGDEIRRFKRVQGQSGVKTW